MSPWSDVMKMAFDLCALQYIHSKVWYTAYGKWGIIRTGWYWNHENGWDLPGK